MDEHDLPSVFPPRLDDAEGPARPLGEEEKRARVESALIACGLRRVGVEEPPEPDERQSTIRELRPRRAPAEPRALTASKKRRVRAAVFAAVFVSGTAAAAITVGWTPLASWLAPAVEESPPKPPPVKLAPTSPALRAPLPQEPLASAEPSVVVPEAPLEETRLPSRQADTRTIPSNAPVAAEDLLGEANALRGQRRYGQALNKYLEVVRRHPGSPQAGAARLAAATLRLEHEHDPQGAIALLENGGVGQVPEAQYLLGESYRAAGRSEREQEVLRSFVARHPNHPLAPKARRRLEALDGDDAAHEER